MLRCLIFAAALTLVAAPEAGAQTPLSCGTAPQSVCEDSELASLETERAALIAQLSADPQAAANEETWIAGLSACGDDASCYRTAYLNHNETLRQAAAALPPTAETPAPVVEAPPPSVEDQTQALDEVQAERLRQPREDGRHAYVDSGAPGWGFYTALAITLAIFWWLMRALRRYRREASGRH